MRFIQWMIGLAVVTASGVATVWLLSPGEVARQREQLEAAARERYELQRAIERVTGETRMAEVYVDDQVLVEDPATGRPRPRTELRFIEYRDGRALPEKRFTIEDDVVFFDALVIQFESDYVVMGDRLRGRSLALFRRVYGEHQNPADGYCIDDEREVPDAFRAGGQANPFERKLWEKFWDYVRNPELAKTEKVRVAQGQAVYAPVIKGDIWTLTLQNNGGINLKLHRPGVRGPMKLESSPPA